ncbi:MAG: asparagine synthase (glutamine-hydrolyzing) [Candidatus Methanomethyliaceae archaeon]
MCGISGIFFLSDRPVPIDATLRMRQASDHREHDEEAVVLFPLESPLSTISFRKGQYHLLAIPTWAILCHHHISILDTSSAGLQPMSSISGSWWIVFNGEICNFLELRRTLPAHPCRSGTDTEVLLELWEKEEEQSLPKLIGMWAFALVSPQKREVILCRDRFGIKPLYYALVGDWLRFASEIRAIFASGLVAKTFDPEAVGSYLAYGMTFRGEESSFYQGISQAPAATLFRVQRGRMVKRVFYSIPERPKLPFEKLLEAVKEVFTDAVHITLRSDVPLAVCLSGGIDSTNVAAAASKCLAAQSGQLIAYTLEPPPPYESEVDPAREIAQSNRCQLKIVPLPPSLSTGELVDFILSNEEPMGSPGAIVQYFLYRCIARDGIRVLLDGQGGDEAFGGYPWIYHPVLQEALKERRFKERGVWLRGILRNGNADPLRIWYMGRIFRNPYLRLNRMAKRLLRVQPSPPDLIPTLRFVSQACSWRQRQVAAYYFQELPVLLHDADRNGMRWALEVRSPFMDPRIVELTHNADPLDLMRQGWSKYVSRSLMDEDRVPSSIRWAKRKRGFYISPTAFVPTAKKVVRTLLPLSRQLPELLQFNTLKREIESGSLSPSFTWQLLNLFILDMASDGMMFPEEAQEALREIVHFSLGTNREAEMAKTWRVSKECLMGGIQWSMKEAIR